MDEEELDIFVRGIIDGTLKLPKPLCKKCGDWGSILRCKNEICEYVDVDNHCRLFSITCKGCKEKMSEYFCEYTYE